MTAPADPAAEPAADPAAAAAAELGPHDVALVLGSGWAGLAGELGEPDGSRPLAGLPGFRAPTVAGHGGSATSRRLAGGRRLLVLAGRTHLYEGAGVEAVVHGVRVAAACGCRQVLLTNAAGAVQPALRVGRPVLIADHLNLTGTSPLTGARFVDLTSCWSPRLRALAREVDPELAEGVYAGLRGPQYETPAEIRMLRALGADLVGMSTVLEAIEARALGLELLGISLVTNLAAGVSGAPLDHGEVLAAGRDSAGRLAELVGGILDRL